MEKNLDGIIVKQENRMIDAVPGWAHELHTEFTESIRDYFTDEEAEKFFKSGLIKINYLTALSDELYRALLHQNYSDPWDTGIIEVTLDDALVGLYFDRRDEGNHSEITYIIFKEKLLSLKNEILEKLK
jgi:hypothetical protein